jgi:LPS export ABC transporter protein LptC
MTGGLSRESMINRYNFISFKQFTRTVIPGILFLCMTASCHNDPKDIKALTDKGTLQEERAHDVVIIYSQRGVAKVRMFGHLFIRNEAAKPPYIDIKQGLRVEFYNDSLKVTTVLTARNARYYEQQGNVDIRDSVIVVNNKGEKLNTEELIWNQGIRRYYTEKPVKITTATQILYGDGLDANEDFTWYQIKNLKGAVKVNKSEMPQ